MNYMVLNPEGFGAGRVYIDTLTRDSASKSDRKKAFFKLRDLIKILFPHVPISKILAISVGCGPSGITMLYITLQQATEQELSQ